MNCRDVQLAILEQSAATLSKDAAAHLEVCAECRAFADLYRQTVENRAPTLPSAELDRQILTAARPLLAARRKQASGPLRFRSWFFRVAAAALVALAFAGTVLLRRAPEHLARQQAGTTARPASTAPGQPAVITWDDLNRDLEQLSREIDSTLADMAADATPTAGKDSVKTAAGGQGASGLDQLDEGLFELECDLYFELRNLQSDG
jgi:hypothetical protein